MSSNNVDERVVKMTFDNGQFEAGVQQTLTSLDELKKSLRFTNALTSIQTLSSAFNSFSLSNITTQLDSVTSRFSTLGIVGMTAIENITNKVLNFTTSKIQSTIGQISSGGWARASSIAQARFTLQGMLKDTEKVEEAFASAQSAVDGTAYSLDSAVSAASQLATTGIGTGAEMENTLKSIAGVAAMTGGSFDDIANIFVDVSSAGRLTGDALTRLAYRGINAKEILAESLGTTADEVKTMASKGEISFQQFSDAMQNTFGEHAKDANKTFTGTVSNIKSALSRIGAIFASGIVENDDLINALNTVRTTINSIKTAMLPLEAKFKNLVSAVSNAFSGVLGEFDVSPFETFINIVGNAMDTITELINKWSEAKGYLKEAIFGEDADKKIEATAEQLERANEAVQKANDIWEKAAYGVGEARKELLGEDYDLIQSLVNQRAAGVTDLTDLAVESVIKSDEALKQQNNTIVQGNQELEKTPKKIAPIASAIGSLTTFGAGIRTIFNNIKITLAKAGSSFKKVFSWKDLIADIKDYGNMFSEFVGHFTLTEERAEKLETSLTGLWSAIDLLRQIIKTVVGGITKSFGPALSVIYDIVLSLLANIGSLITRLKEWYEENDLLKSIFEFLGNTLKNVILFASNFFNELSNMSVIYTIKEKLKDLAELISEKLTPFFGDAKDKINEFFGEMNGEDSTKITDVIGNINEVLETLIGYIDDGKGKLEDFFGFISDKFGKLFGIKETLDQVTGGVEELNEATAGTSTQKASLFANIPYFDKIMEFVKSFGSGLFERIKNIKAYQVVLTGFGTSLIILALNINSFVSTIKGSFKSFGQIGESIKGVFNSISGIFNQIKKNIAMNTTLTLLTKVTILIGVLAAALIGLSLVDTKKLLIASGVMVTLLGLITAITLAFYNFMKKDEWSSLIKFESAVKPLNRLFISLSAAVFLLAAAIAKLSEVQVEGIWIKFAVLAGTMASLAGVAILISKFAPQISTGGLSLVAFSLAVYILVKALSKLHDVDIEAIKGKLVILIGIIVVVGLVAAAATSLSGMSLSSGFGLLTVIGSLILMEIALNYIVTNGVDLEAIKNNLSKFLAVFGVLALLLISVKLLGSSTGKILGNVILLITITLALKTIATILVQLAQAARNGGLLSGIMALYAIFGGVFAILYIINMNASEISKASGVLLSIAGTIAVIAIIATLIGNVPFAQLAKGIGSIIVIIASLGAFMVLVSRFSKEKIDWKPLVALSSAIISIGITLALISLIAKDNPEAVIISAIALGLSLISLGLAFTLASKSAEKIHAAGLLTMISSIVMIAGSLALLTFLQTKGGSILKSTFAIAAILAALTAAYYVIASNNLKMETKDIAGLGTLVSSLVTIAFAIQLLNTAQSTGSILKSVIALTWLLAMLVNGVEVLSGLDKGLSWGVVASLGVLVVGLLVIAVSIKLLLDGDYSWGDMIVSALAMSVVLAVMVGSLALLSNIASSSPLAMIAIGVAAAALAVTLIGFSVAMIAFATSIKILIACLRQLTTIDYSAINVTVLIELCGVVALLGVSAGIASVGVLALSVGLAVIAASMLVASVAMAIMTPQIIALLAAFTAFTLVGDKVAAGIDAISASIASAIVAIAIGLANGIASFITTIASKAPQITTAVNVILASILVSIASSIVTINTIIINGLINLLSMLEQKLPVLSEKLTHVIEIILQVIANHAVRFGYYGSVITVNFIAGMILGLAAGLKPLMSSIGMFVLKFINGIGDAVYEYSDRIVASMQYLSDVMYNALLKSLAATVPGVGALIGGEIEESNQRIEDWQAKRYTDIGETTTDSLADSISDGTDKVADATENMVDEATDASGVANSNAKDTAGSFFGGLTNSFNSTSLKSGVTDTVTDMFGIDLSGEGAASMDTFFSGMSTGAKENKVDVSSIPESVKAQLKDEGYTYSEDGKYLVKQIQAGSEEEAQNYGDFWTDEADPSLMSAMDETTENTGEKATEAKDNYIDGLVDLTDDDLRRIREEYARTGQAMVVGTSSKDGIDSSSPSKKAIQLGNYFVDGLIVGGEELSSKLSDSYAGLGNNAVVAAANSMSTISNILQDDSINWTPTLTPVIDSSQLQNGSNLLTATFGNSALNMAADTALSVKDTESGNLAAQVAALSEQVKKLADTDYSELLKGVNINVNAETNVDGTRLRKMASSYTIEQIDTQQSNYNMSRGARA